MAAPAQPDFECLFQGLLHWHGLLAAARYNIAHKRGALDLCRPEVGLQRPRGKA